MSCKTRTKIIFLPNATTSSHHTTPSVPVLTLSLCTVHFQQALCKDVDVFGEQVDGCKEHYEATLLGLLSRCLREKKELASRAIGERVRVARSGVSFYKGMERVSELYGQYQCRGN